MPRGYARRVKGPTRRWFGINWQGETITQAQKIVKNMFTMAGQATPVTVVRNRGDFLIVAEPDAAADVITVGFGIIVVQESAATAGGVSVPGPLTDPDANWLWHEYVGLDAVVLTAGDANARSVIHRVRIDSKAMRKVPLDQSLILVSEASANTMAVLTSSGGWRSLVQS